MQKTIITGSIVQAYVICSRQAWLMSRNISGNQYNDFIAIGRLLSEETYRKDKKEILIGGNKIDIIRGDDNSLTLIEIKKSLKMVEASEMQLLYYMYGIKDKEIEIKGEIRIPKEKKVIPVDLTKEGIKKVEETITSIEELLKNEDPPRKIRLKYCKTCSYLEFCWA